MARRTAQFSFPTYPAHRLIVSWGANEKDPIGGPADVAMGDIYRLHREAEAQTLAIWDGPEGQEVADGSQVGRPGDRVMLEVCHSLMAPDGTLIDVLVLSVSGDDDTTRHFLPLAPMEPRGEYELVASETDTAPARLADIACVSFLAGTHLTLAGGAQKPVEDLAEGDRLLTRDHGPRPIRWIGQQVQRATGALAPVRIREGTLNVARDLRLSPHHRLFIWQRRDELGTGRAEVLVKAAHLVNGDTVAREEGGFVETYQIVFDSHEIIYAEGVAVESLLVTPHTRAALPQGVGADDNASDRMNAAEIEVQETALEGEEDPATKLTRASHGKSRD